MTADTAAKTVSALFESWYSSLVRYASRATGSFALAEDLVQETFMQLYRELRAGKTVDQPKAWTFSLLRRSIGRHVRNHARQIGAEQPLEVAEALPSIPSRADTAQIELDELSKLFSILTRREEEVLLLRMEAFKYREIADRLGISANSVNTLLARALRKLQKAATGRPQKSPASKQVENSVRKTTLQ